MHRECYNIFMKTILVDAVDAFVIEGEGIFREMYDLLETFPNKKIILTGANDEQFKELGLDKMPYEVFTLKHNPEKTNPKYYETMLQHFGLSKDDVVYFEHNPEAVKSAESAGIKSFFYDPEKRKYELRNIDLNEIKAKSGIFDLLSADNASIPYLKVGNATLYYNGSCFVSAGDTSYTRGSPRNPSGSRIRSLSCLSGQGEKWLIEPCAKRYLLMGDSLYSRIHGF